MISRERLTACLASLIVALVSTGCGGVRDNPLTCRTNEECESKRCNLATFECDQMVDAATVPDSRRVDGPSAPTPDTQGTLADASVDAPMVDALPVDTKPPVDAPTPDTAPYCVRHTDCPEATPICGPDGKSCVTCQNDGECASRSAALPICGSGRCFQCTGTGPTTKGCSGTTPLCSANKCVECLADSDCPAASPICDVAQNRCGKCTMDAQCAKKSAAAPACLTSAGTCVACTRGKDHCSAGSPICDATSHACRTCRRDAECIESYGADPGACVEQGRCATDAEVLYVQNRAECSESMRGTGTAQAPFCFSQDAIGNLSSSKRIVVIRGPLDNTSFTVGYSASPVMVIGQNRDKNRTADRARLVPPVVGTPPVVTVTAGDVLLRGLEVSGGKGVGISASGGGTVRVSKCVVENNQGVGILIDGVGFDITNTVIVKNGGVSKAGVELGTVPNAGSVKRFSFNTVVDNGFGGVVCGASYGLVGVLASGNGGVPFSPSCTVDATTNATTDPGIMPGTLYKLGQSSTCVDKVASSDLADDIDSNPRPSPVGGRFDCGAFELQK